MRCVMDPKSLFSLNDHLEMLSRHGDPLEVLERTVDFECFQAWLIEGWAMAMAAKAVVSRSIPSPCSRS